MSIHEHCVKCVSRNCNKDSSFIGFGDESCPMVECTNQCGFRYHECKQEEHLILCPNLIVSCVNSINGCPKQMPRYKVLGHIAHCPASVVQCSQEWNRWKSADVDDLETVEVQSPTPTLDSSDVLDLALATRDQRHFEEAIKMPKSLRKSLKNPFTNNFPAVPLAHRGLSEKTQSDDEEGGAESLSSLDSDDDIDGSECSHHPPEKNYKYDQIACSLCRARAKAKNSGLASSIDCALTNIRVRVNEQSSAQQESSNLETSQESGPISSNKTKEKSNKGRPVVRVDIEMFNSFRAKPSKMLTFLCAQDFRRDQFAQHYKNVHCEIQAGLDGWHQVRCPLSVYGCRYTVQRFVTSDNKKIVYNPVNECFTPISINDMPVNAVDDWLIKLPEEVLLTILSYLDSQSLKTFALTSKKMRDVCSQLLTDRGMVVLNWRKENSHWRVYEKIWSFSTAFDPIESWKFASLDPLANHLSYCPYFTVEAKVFYKDLYKQSTAVN